MLIAWAYNSCLQIEHMQAHDQQQSVIYFTILIVIEILVFIFSMASNQRELTFFNIIRIVMLIGAKCMESISWVVQYIIFAIICALYSFDPVGLWLIGHGQARTGPQNAFCVVIFIILVIAVYVGYLFKKTFEKEIQEDFVGEGYSNPSQGFHTYRPQQPSYFPQANSGESHPQQPEGPKRKGFQQFSGQAYSLA